MNASGEFPDLRRTPRYHRINSGIYAFIYEAHPKYRMTIAAYTAHPNCFWVDEMVAGVPGKHSLDFQTLATRAPDA